MIKRNFKNGDLVVIMRRRNNAASSIASDTWASTFIEYLDYEEAMKRLLAYLKGRHPELFKDTGLDRIKEILPETEKFAVLKRVATGEEVVNSMEGYEVGDIYDTRFILGHEDLTKLAQEKEAEISRRGIKPDDDGFIRVW